MLYPIMPLYLKSIGFSVFLIGLLEGIAEATAGLSKGYFGRWSDERASRLPFIQAGYALSTISKPMMAVFSWPLWIFFARTLDRFGKGIRTGARDALLSDEATPETKGGVFGFHRAMDTLGAAIGPSLALLYLYFYPENYIALFYIAFIPGSLAVLASFLLKEKKREVDGTSKRIPLSAVYSYWKTSPSSYKTIVGGLLAFALFNSSDIFILLRAKEAGFSDSVLIGMYIFYNLIYALFAYPLGRLSDKLGLRNVFIIGLVLFALTYILLIQDGNIWLYGVAIFIYGIYAAATYGISKAWISNITPKEETAAAIGTYSGFQSVCAMIASTLAGFIWYKFGSTPTFILTAAASIGVAIYFLTRASNRNAVEMH